jgi:hypothetical protein
VTGSIRCLTRLAACATLCALAATAGAATASASTSCGIVTASGHPWIIVAKGVPCTRAKSVTRHFAARTAGLRSGARLTVPSPLRGFTCVLASQGKPGGSCSTAGAARSVLWIVAA